MPIYRTIGSTAFEMQLAYISEEVDLSYTALVTYNGLLTVTVRQRDERPPAATAEQQSAGSITRSTPDGRQRGGCADHQLPAYFYRACNSAARRPWCTSGCCCGN